jgi:hypothetical protein
MGITAPGTEFFRPETKPKFRVVSPARDQISKIVRRTGRVNAACSHKVSVIRDSGDCVVADAVLVEPVSNENSLLTGKLTGNFAFLGPQKPISLHETTVLQRLFTKFPTQINRENISKNREFLAVNREFHLRKSLSGARSHS